MHSPTTVLFALALVSLGGACARADAQSTMRPGPVRDAAAPPADLCATIRANYAAVLATATGRCASASDCGCYAPVSGGCGDVTDRATLARLEPIVREFHAAHCRWLVQCAPWACQPRCERGRCVR